MNNRDAKYTKRIRVYPCNPWSENPSPILNACSPPNVPDQRPRATNVRHGTEAQSRGSLPPVCSANGCSGDEERESALRALLRAHRILEFASFALFADRDWRLASRRDLHAGSVRYGFAPFT